MEKVFSKISPSREKFKKLALSNNLIVLSYKFFSDWLTPLSVYHNLSKKLKGESFLLESIEGEEKICRFSFLGFMPICVFKSRGKKITIAHKDTTTFTTKKDPLHELKKLMAKFKVAPKESLRFFGGFIGYAGYDAVRFYEPIGKDLPDSLKTDDLYFILPKFLIIFDHVSKQIELLSFVHLERKTNLDQIYSKEKDAIARIYKRLISAHRLPVLDFQRKNLRIKSNFKKEKFLSAVKKIKHYIKEGEIIQTVLAQRFSVEFKSDPFLVYRYMRILNPSPYMFYLDFGRLRLAGSSPEMLLRCENKVLTTRPIAGTRKRGKTDAKDLLLEQELLADAKEQAEHIMLVDLARNDLGKVAQPATVEVPIFMTVERFSHVMHIVSEARARLSDSENIFSALTSCFPAGTVSGAPKVRAMQIINELEPDRRGIYAGSVGYFSFTKSLDTCIIIRTIVFKNNMAYIQAGAGIVSDSKPENEYKETLNKAKAQILALEFANSCKK